MLASRFAFKYIIGFAMIGLGVSMFPALKLLSLKLGKVALFVFCMEFVERCWKYKGRPSCSIMQCLQALLISADAAFNCQLSVNCPQWSIARSAIFADATLHKDTCGTLHGRKTAKNGCEYSLITLYISLSYPLQRLICSFCRCKVSARRSFFPTFSRVVSLWWVKDTMLKWLDDGWMHLFVKTELQQLTTEITPWGEMFWSCPRCVWDVCQALWPVWLRSRW